MAELSFPELVSPANAKEKRPPSASIEEIVMPHMDITSYLLGSDDTF